MQHESISTSKILSQDFSVEISPQGSSNHSYNSKRTTSRKTDFKLGSPGLIPGVQDTFNWVTHQHSVKAESGARNGKCKHVFIKIDLAWLKVGTSEAMQAMKSVQLRWQPLQERRHRDKSDKKALNQGGAKIRNRSKIIHV